MSWLIYLEVWYLQEVRVKGPHSTPRMLLLLLRQDPYRSRVRELTVGPELLSTFERWKNHYQVNIGVQRPTWAFSADLVLSEVGLHNQYRKVEEEKERIWLVLGLQEGSSSPQSEKLL